MSALALAPRALKRRTLERMGMTPEQELELLIAEQQADDTYFIDRPSHIISIDAPAPNGEGTIGDLIGYDPDTEELITAFPLPPTPPMANASQHGSIYAYARLKCRCRPCKDAKATYEREKRQQRAES